MADAHADAIRLIGAVNQVTRHREFQHAVAERIVRARLHDGRVRISKLPVLAPYRGRHVPHRVFCFGDHLGVAQWCFPTDAADADRIGQHLHGLAIGDFREIEEPLRGDVQDEPASRNVGQHVLCRQQYRHVGTRQPWVDVWIGGNHFVETEPILAREIGERVFFARVDNLRFADHRLLGGLEHEEISVQGFLQICLGSLWNAVLVGTAAQRCQEILDGRASTQQCGRRQDCDESMD